MPQKNKNRSTYRSKRTARQMRNLPGWLKKSPDTDLWKLLEGPNILTDEAESFLEDTGRNMLPITYNASDREPVYVSDPQLRSPASTYSSESGNVQLTLTDELEDFFYGPPTRVETETGNYRVIPEITRIVQDVHFIDNIRLEDGSQDDVHESGGAIAVLQENAYSDSDAFTFFTSDWQFIKSVNVASATQDFESAGKDEWIELGEGDGLHYKLNHYPLKDSVSIKNVFALDSFGDAQEIPTTYTQSGDFVNFAESIIGSGTFIAEYDYVEHKSLRSFAPANLLGTIGHQPDSSAFKDTIIKLPQDHIELEPDINIELDDTQTHEVKKIQELVPASIKEVSTINSRDYLVFSVPRLRPGMDIQVGYWNESGEYSAHSRVAEKLNDAYQVYGKTAIYAVGIDVTDLLPSSKQTFTRENFRVSRYRDACSVIPAAEEHVYGMGTVVRRPNYALDRVGHYIEEIMPESGGMVRRNPINLTRITSDLPDLRDSYPAIQDVLFSNPELIDPTLPQKAPIAIRRWGSWILVLQRSPSTTVGRPYIRFDEPSNLGESPTYELLFIDIDTFKEYKSLTFPMDFEPTSFMIDAQDTLHIVGYKGLPEEDYLTPHVFSLDSSLELTEPGALPVQYDRFQVSLDIPAATAKVRVQHVPSETMVYTNDTFQSGEFTAEGWGNYRVSGEYNSETFDFEFAVEPTTNRRVQRQPLKFRYDYAMRISIDDEREVVYFRERYPWGIDKSDS